MALSFNNLNRLPVRHIRKNASDAGLVLDLGKTAGRGHKGQKSRSGYSSRPGFEGGQMPLQRRLPKRGFTNIFKKEWIEISLAKIEESFNAGDDVTPEILHERGLIKKAKHDLVILGNGDVTKATKDLGTSFYKDREGQDRKSRRNRDRDRKDGGRDCIDQLLVSRFIV